MIVARPTLLTLLTLRALLTLLALLTPFTLLTHAPHAPQVLISGPPGIGKTTAARVVLQVKPQQARPTTCSLSSEQP